MFLTNSLNPSSTIIKSLFYNLPFINPLDKITEINNDENRNELLKTFLYSEMLEEYDPLKDSLPTLSFGDFSSSFNFRLQILKTTFASSTATELDAHSVDRYFGNRKPNIKNVFGSYPGSLDSLVWDSLPNIPIKTWRAKTAFVGSLSLFSNTRDFDTIKLNAVTNYENGARDLSQENIRNLFYLFLLKENPKFLKSKFNVEESWFDENLNGIKESKDYIEQLAFERKFNINYFLLKANPAYIDLLNNLSEEEKSVVIQYKDAFFEKEILALQRAIAYFAFLTQEKMHNFFYQEETKTNFYNSCKNDSFFKAQSEHKIYNTFAANYKYFEKDSLGIIRNVHHDSQSKEFMLQKRVITNHILNARNRVEHNGKVYHTNLPSNLVSQFNIIPALNLPDFNFEANVQMNDLFGKIGGATVSNTNKMTLGRLADISFMDYKELANSKYYVPKEDLKTDNFLLKEHNESMHMLSNTIKSIVTSEEPKQTLTMKSIIDTAFQPYQNSQIKCICIDKFFASSEDDFTFYLSDLKFNKITSKTATFVPVSVTLKVKSSHSLFSPTQQEEEINYLFLLNLNCDTSKIETYVRAQKSLAKLTDYITYKDAIYFFDKEAYNKQISKIFGETAKFSNLFSDYLHEKFPSLFTNYSMFSNPAVPKPVERKAFKTLTAKPKVETALEEKFLKLKNQQKSIKEHLEKAERDLEVFENHKRYFEQEFENHTRIANESLQKLNDYKNKIQESVISKNGFSETYNKFLQTYSKVETEYLKAYNENLNSSNFEEDPFFSNLELDGIYISSIKLEGTNNNRITLDFNSSNFNANDIQDLINKKYTIESLEIVFSKPVKIKVDSSNNFVYGGPYKVSVKSSSMQINALNKSTIFGIDKNNKKIILHPHASQTAIFRNDSIQSLCFSERNCCLGEASPYIYNAFKENNLKMILVNVMIWVSSANSSDAWGKNYKFFPKTIKNVTEDQQELTEEIVEELQSTEEDMEIPTDAECEHEEHYQNGICMECGVYHEWADYDNEEDEYEEQEHYDQVITPEEVNVTQNVYVPYTQLTNTNNNQG